MRLSHDLVKRECAKRGISLKSLLKASGVSSNAYYSLVGKESAIPKSISRIAETLDISPAKLLFDERALLDQHLALLAEVDRIAEANPDADRDTIRHTLILLNEPPIDRLRRALSLGRLRHSR